MRLRNFSQRKITCSSNESEVIGYSDSDFAGCIDTRKSTFGYLFMFAQGAISWKSAKQTIVASSTMEAEFVACLKPQFMHYGCGTLFQDLWLSTPLASR